jgi:hypothetical protein
MCGCVCECMVQKYTRGAVMICSQGSCILPGRAKTSVNLLRKVFHTTLDRMAQAGDEAMAAMQAN